MEPERGFANFGAAILPMKTLARRLSLFIWLLLPLIPQAQQVLSESRYRFRYSIPYVKHGGDAFVHGNEILREMAKEVLREPWQVNIRLSGEIRFKVIQTGGEMQLKASFLRRMVEGDTLYRKFPVSRMLFPSRVSMTLRWANKADTSGFAEEPVSFVRVTPGDSILFRRPVSLYDPTVDTLIVTEVRFAYDSADLARFMNGIGRIHDYHASLALLDTLRRISAGMTTDDREHLPEYAMKAWEMSLVLNRIANREFEGTLLADGTDPGRFTARYKEIYRESKTRIYNLIDALGLPEKLEWDRDAGRLAGYLTTRVLTYVRLSNLMDLLQGAIYRDCLEHAFDGEAAPPGKEVFLQLLTRMYPEAQADTLPRFFAGRVLQEYRRLAASLMEGKEYAQAWDVLENSRRFAGLVPDAGIEENEILSVKAAEGVFNSFAGIAATCIERRQFEMADRYLAKASAYRAEHLNYIQSDSVYRAAFGVLFFLRNGDCDKLLEDKSYAEALECYHDLEQRYRPEVLAPVRRNLDDKLARAASGLAEQSVRLTAGALRHNQPDSAMAYYDRARQLQGASFHRTSVDDKLDSLAPALTRLRISKLETDGAEALENRHYTRAVGYFREARSLALENRIDAGRVFDSLYRQAMKMYLVVRLYSARKVIWVNRFDSAQLALDRTEQTAFDFGLQNDSLLKASMDLFRAKIREQHCANLRDSVDLRMIRAGRAAALHNYTGARRTWEEALGLLGNMPGCGIPEQPIRDSIRKYAPAADWQSEEVTVATLAAAGKYPEAIRRCLDHLATFERENLERFGLRAILMPEFLEQRQNPHLTWAACQILMEKGETMKALDLLLLACSQGFPAGQTATAQEQLGTRMARDDFRKAAGSAVATGRVNHVPPDKMFDRFRKAYAKEYEALKK